MALTTYILEGLVLLRQHARVSLRRSLWVAIASVSVLAGESRAVDRSWLNSAGGGFNTASNWEGNVVPGNTDVATFGLTRGPTGPTFTVTFANNVTTQGLRIENDAVTLDMNLRTYSTGLTGARIGTVVDGRTGALTITDGIWSAGAGSNVFVGAASTGPLFTSGSLTVTLDGQIARLAAGNPVDFQIGQAGRGTFLVRLGGLVSLDSGQIGVGASGTATVTDPNSRWTSSGTIAVGAQRNGTLNVRNNGLVQNVNGIVGRDLGSVGTATVADTNSQWINSDVLTVGDGGNGTLNIGAGGLVQDVTGVIGRDPGSVGTATVADNGSQWINSDVLTVGDGGNGTLNIGAGGLVQNLDGVVGLMPNVEGTVNGKGTVNVDGANARWNNTDDLVIGALGTGTVNISAGGLVESTDGFIGSSELAGQRGTGTVAVDGANSRWINLGQVIVGAFGTGTLEIKNGGEVRSANPSAVGEELGSTGMVKVMGAAAGVASKWIQDGVLIVGEFGKGTIDIAEGGQVQTEAALIGKFAGGEGKITVSDPSSLFENLGPLTIGDHGLGTMEVTLGGQVRNTDATMGAMLGGANTVTVKDSGSLWANSGDLMVGYEGAGELTIEAGGRVESTGAVLGRGPSSIGTVTVSNAGSLWENSGALTVGRNGRGSLQILDGGHVNSGNGSIGVFNSLRLSSVIVRGENSQWIVDNSLDVGGGLMEIRDGGYVKTGPAFCGSITPGSDGNCLIIVEGAGSTWDTESLTLGSNTAQGVLTIDPGGVVNISRHLLTLGFAGDGTLNLNGGEINLGDAPGLRMGDVVPPLVESGGGSVG
jgi:T5SS/PEP-CTERM-associated repeat protein